MKRSYLFVLGLAALATFATFVWPTQWRYEHAMLAKSALSSPSQTLIRIHRFQGKTEVLTEYGWIDTRTRAGVGTAGDPFADIQPSHR